MKPYSYRGLKIQQDKQKIYWYLDYRPKDREKYDSLYVENYWHYKPKILYYKVVNNGDVSYVSTRTGEYKLMEGFAFKKLQEFIKEMFNLEFKNRDDLPKKIVGDLLNECCIGYISVPWNGSRTIAFAHTREVLAYTKSYFGLLITFRNKKNRIQTFQICKERPYPEYCWSKAYELKYKDAIETYQRIKDKKLGRVYLSEKTKQAMLDDALVEQL